MKFFQNYGASAPMLVHDSIPWMVALKAWIPASPAWRGCDLSSSVLRPSTTFLVLDYYSLLLSAEYLAMLFKLSFFELSLSFGIWYLVFYDCIIFGFDLWMIVWTLVLFDFYSSILCWLPRTLAFWCCQKGRETRRFRSFRNQVMMPYDHDVLMPYEYALLKLRSRQKSKRFKIHHQEDL